MNSKEPHACDHKGPPAQVDGESDDLPFTGVYPTCSVCGMPQLFWAAVKTKKMNSQTPHFPGGSKSRVNRAGDSVRDRNSTIEDMFVIEEWRAAHRAVLNTFQAVLRTRTRNTDVVVAQRHKRQRTIFGKLDRFPEMELSRMDDVAGCRLIFPTLIGLYAFRESFHKARFKHKRRNAVDKYDYIKQPKKSGYRGIHDVYEYDVRSATNQGSKGLLVEIQYRTLVQHAWATANEVIGFVTESQPKFEQGDKRYQDAMALASEVMARAFESLKGPFPDMDDQTVVQEFLAMDSELGLMNMLRGLDLASSDVTAKRNAILVISKTGVLDVKSFRDATEALRALFSLEKEHPENDIVLVRADTTEDVQLAFRNYFSDARDFVRMMDDGCAKLSGKKVYRQLKEKPAKPRRRRVSARNVDIQ